MRAVTVVPILVLALSACGPLLTESTADVAGVAGAGIASSVSNNATVGAAIGLGVASVATAGLQYAERRVHREEQDRIAAAAGALPEGAAGTWSVSHSVPIEPSEHGEVVVTRILAARPTDGPGFTCKEIVFSVDQGADKHGVAQRGFYTATVCLNGSTWKWASAEPATARWGSLQ
jgi:hypothetical protein